MTSVHAIPDAAGFAAGVGTEGPAETAALGERVAGLLAGGEIILLHGGLGAGKTCFVQGLCRGLGITDGVVSPTFTLVNTHDGRLRVHHLDFYRIEAGDDLSDIGVPDLLDEVADGSAVLVAEWPGPLLPSLGTAARVELLAVPGAGPDQRQWMLRGQPSPAPSWHALFTAKAERC